MTLSYHNPGAEGLKQSAGRPEARNRVFPHGAAATETLEPDRLKSNRLETIRLYWLESEQDLQISLIQADPILV
jgi:hypothetical protein